MSNGVKRRKTGKGCVQGRLNRGGANIKVGKTKKWKPIKAKKRKVKYKRKSRIK